MPSRLIQKLIVIASAMCFIAWCGAMALAYSLWNQVKVLESEVSKLKDKTSVIGIDNKGTLHVEGNINLKRK